MFFSKGPSDIVLERFEDCDNPEKYPFPMGVMMSKINRTHAGISTCIDLGCPMDDTVTVRISI